MRPAAEDATEPETEPEMDPEADPEAEPEARLEGGAGEDEGRALGLNDSARHRDVVKDVRGSESNCEQDSR